MIKRVIIKNYKGIKNADIAFHSGKNIIVGDNGVGKSTIIEAIALALGDGLSRFEISPYIFHNSSVHEYVNTKIFPEILIEVFFDTNAFPRYSGKNYTSTTHSSVETGIRFRVVMDTDALDLDNETYETIPFEYYHIERNWFSGEPLKHNNICDLLFVDSSSAFFHGYNERFVVRLLQSILPTKDNIEIRRIVRELKDNFDASKQAQAIKTQLLPHTKKVHEDLSMSIDLSSFSTFSKILSPFLNDIPLSQIGLGDQCIIKSLLCLVKDSDNSGAANNKERVVIIEEPETHLSHTKLHQLLSAINDAVSSQLIITSHSSYVANRLDLSNIIIISNSNGEVSTATLHDSNEMLAYFTKQPNFPTLRIALCKSAILVEGPTDEMIVEYQFKKIGNNNPFTERIELISVNSLAFKRFLFIACQLNKKIAVITDNDKMQFQDVENKRLGKYKDNPNIRLFTEPDISLHTLEPSFVRANKDKLEECAKIVRYPQNESVDENSLSDYLENHKAEWSYRLLMCEDSSLSVPSYIEKAINWIRDE